MRVLVLHSDVEPNPAAEDMDTLLTAEAVARTLTGRGHHAPLAPFVPGIAATRATLETHRPDVVVNLVETIEGKGELAPYAASVLAMLNARFTGAPAGSMALTNDKPLTKNMLAAADLPTPDWSTPPDWAGLDPAKTYVVKAAAEDASLGLDDAAVVPGDAVAKRAAYCAAMFGGRWFAEEFIEGREFNVSMLETPDGPKVLPIPEMRFENWPADRPRIVGHAAKWNDDSVESRHTARAFGIERSEPALNAALTRLSLAAWRLCGLRGYARVDFRVDAGEPTILEINTNPCLHPDAGFAAAGAAAGMSYGGLIERILDVARKG